MPRNGCVKHLINELITPEQCMDRLTTPSLAEILRNTLECIERDMEITPDDPALTRLKQAILRTLADLEIRKANAA
jgi:hypothetical protein